MRKTGLIFNKGIPGDNTKDALERFESDVLVEDADFLLVGLSMANEGLETENPDSVFISFETGMKKIIEKCENNGIVSVLGLCYANNNFTPEQYGYLKRMNVLMNSWGVPCINFLGALDDGSGHFPPGTTFDPNHPDNLGHEEFFLAIPPGLFEALTSNKNIPQRVDNKSLTRLGKKGKYKQLYYFPSQLMHSFSFGFDFKTKKGSVLAEIIAEDFNITIGINKKSCIEYKDGNDIINSSPISTDQWHRLMISHRYMSSKTTIYLDGDEIGVLNQRIEPLAYMLGSIKSTAEYRQLLIYRAALTPEEILANDNTLIHASLDLYVPLNDEQFDNLALNNTQLIINPEAVTESLNHSKEIHSMAALARANELKIEPKKPIELDPAIYQQYKGEYVIAEDDSFIVEVEDNKIYFNDRGRRAEILPEAENVFFIHYPGDITFTFEKDENGNVTTLTANFNGYKLTGIKK